MTFSLGVISFPAFTTLLLSHYLNRKSGSQLKSNSRDSLERLNRIFINTIVSPLNPSIYYVCESYLYTYQLLKFAGPIPHLVVGRFRLPTDPESTHLVILGRADPKINKYMTLPCLCPSFESPFCYWLCQKCCQNLIL